MIMCSVAVVSAEFVPNRESNLMTMFGKIVLRAGLNPWPMPGNNMRGSLVTDLYNGKYPEIGIHTIADWIGHSPEIAIKHYTRIRDEDFDKVRSKKRSNNTTTNALSGVMSKENHKIWTEQITEQTPPEMPCNKPKRKSQVPIKTASCISVLEAANGQIPPRGFEPLLPD